MSAPEIAVAYVSIVPEIQGFARQLRQQVVGPAETAGAEAGQAAGTGLKDALKLGAAAAGLAAGAVLAQGLTEAFDQANIQKKMQAQLGASSKDAARYGQAAGKLFTSGVVDNFQEGADAIKAVMTSGIAPPAATNAQLQKVATKAADVAKVFDQDLGGVTNAVSQLMRTGLAKNSTEAFDLITKGFQSSANKADDLLDTVNEYSVQFKRFGLDGATAMGLINQAVKAGARDSDQVADALGQFGERALAGGTAVEDAYKSIGLNAGDMAKKIGAGGSTAKSALTDTLNALRGTKDEQVKLNAAAALFGDPANVMGDALYAMDTASAAASGGFSKAAGASANLGKTMRSGPMHDLKVFTRELQQGFVGVMGTYVIPAIKTGAGVFLNDLVPAFSSGYQWALRWSPVLTGLAVLVGGLTLAVKANAIATAFSAGVTKGAAFFTNAWAGAQAILNAVMALNPFVLVAIAIAALVAGIVVAYQRSETFRKIVDAAFRAVGNAGKWLWENALKPVFSSIATQTVWLWQKVIKPYWNFSIAVFKLVGSAAMGLYDNAIKPAYNWIAEKAVWLWDKALKPSFNAMKAGVKLVGESFGLAKTVIGNAWDDVQGIAKKPVSFLIKTVYNRGIVGVWNKVATAFGANPLKEFHPQGFAKGGVYDGIRPGYTPGRDNALIAVGGGESIMRPEWTRAMGAGYVNSMNALARKGGVGAVRKAMSGGLPAFKDGGIFGWVDKDLLGGYGSKAYDTVKAGASWLKDDLASSARAGVESVVNPLLSQIPGLNTGWGQALKGLPTKAVDALFGYSAKADKRLGNGKWARPVSAGIGTRYGVSGPMWSSGRHTGTDFPAPTGTLVKAVQAGVISAVGGSGPYGNHIRMNHPGGLGSLYAHLSSVAIQAGESVAKGQTIGRVGSTGNSSGPHLHLEAFRKGARVNPETLFDNGGWLMPGAQNVGNETGKPEPVFTSGQWSVLSTLAARGADSSAGGVTDGARLVLVTEGSSFEAYVDRRADDRIKSGLTGPAALGRTL
ncbi:peptidoglycan DD-metalloendopeptidase family protein [Streptomyces sp. NPDC088729]|uniref:peptidoglycan DD-metalloendopeptidase family protein n=1 Tax=Streptomyces sp. NPDC088729 TaxID=3365876 RepID=UPI0038127128